MICLQSSIFGEGLSLKIAGTVLNGFHVNVYNDAKLLLTNTEEFSIQLFNNDLSTTAVINFTGNRWTGNDKCIVLTKELYVKEFDANLSVMVKYEVLNAGLIKKTVSLFQASMPGMLYILSQKEIAADKPKRYLTFECDSFPGGLVQEMFPAVGFITNQNFVVGFLTDAGYINQYTRNTRRRFSGREGGFTGLRKLPDPELFTVASPDESAVKDDYIKLTFGEYYNLDAGLQTLVYPAGCWQKEGKATFINSDSILTIANNFGGKSGIHLIAPFKDQKVYTISFMCKGNGPLTLKLYRIREGKQMAELENGLKYIDNFKLQNNSWTLFKGSIFVPFIKMDSVQLFIGTPSDSGTFLQIKNLQFIEHQPVKQPYNILPIGEKIEKISFVFIEPYISHQQFMIAAQARLAEGKGFKGSLIEKMLYANFNMLTWITDLNDFTPFNVPNFNYAPDMYNRDSYFSTVATYNKKLNLSIWEQWGKTQNANGCIGTIITPGMGSVEAKDNEATIEWLIWAMLNKRRFKVTLPQDKIKKAVDYVLKEFDAGKDGKCRSHFSLSQIDIIDYNPATDRLAVNQGMLAIALRTIKELGFKISTAYLQKVEQEYRNFYDTKRKHLLFDRNFPDLISLTDLEPEFFSLWLFNRPMLTNEMVINHLNLIPILNKVAASPHPQYGTTAPICVRLTNDAKGFAYLSAAYQPFEEFGKNNYSDGKNDGFYYNGGSWFRAEYCAYVVGLKHGWKKAPALMENRVWAEIYLNPAWPFSKEFIPTKYSTTDSWWPSTKGLCWNVFILMANELAGLRTPDMDPDYKK